MNETKKFSIRIFATYKMLAWLYANANALCLIIKHDPLYEGVVTIAGKSDALVRVCDEFFTPEYAPKIEETN